MNRKFIEGKIQTAQRYIKRRLISPVIREMQVKRTMIQLPDQSQKVTQCHMEMQGDGKPCSQLWEKQLDPSFWRTISCMWRNEAGSCPPILRKITHQPRPTKHHTRTCMFIGAGFGINKTMESLQDGIYHVAARSEEYNANPQPKQL